MMGVPRVTRLAACLGAVLGMAGGAVAGAQAPPPIPVTLFPSDARGNRILSPGYFAFTAAPGSTTRLYAVAGNESRRTATIRVVPVDAATAVYGGVSYSLPGQRRRGVGAWVRLPGNSFTVRPARGTIIAFDVRVPRGVKPGQYVGGLSAYVPATKRNRAGFGIRVQTRIVDGILITVPGAERSRFSVLRVRAARRPDAWYVVARLVNSGTTLLPGSGHLWVWRQGSRKAVISTAMTIGRTVPRTRFTYPVRLGKRPVPGTYTFSIKVWWNGGKAAMKGRFTVARP